MSAVPGSQTASQSPRLAPPVSVKSQVSLTVTFRRPSPPFADLRGNVCGHCADIDTRAPGGGSMAWIKTRTTDDGDTRFVACYRDPEGRQRSAGTYSSRRAAERAAHREEAKVRDGAWHDHSRGQITFAEYVETVWLPSKHVETSTLAAYRSYLDKHFIPTFGRRPMGKILPTEIQRWVTTATDTSTGTGLSAASVRKYHTMLHSVFERAQRDRVVTFNPCAHTELPKVIKRKARTLTPDEYVAILTALPAQHRLLVETAINTGLRWGELIALKPRHLDLATGR